LNLMTAVNAAVNLMVGSSAAATLVSRNRHAQRQLP
jgi:hypothetical protein